VFKQSIYTVKAEQIILVRISRDDDLMILMTRHSWALILNFKQSLYDGDVFNEKVTILIHDDDNTEHFFTRLRLLVHNISVKPVGRKK